MTIDERTEYIDKVVTIAYFWLSSENYQCSQTIFDLLKKLKLNKTEEKRVNDLGDDIKTVAKSNNFTLEKTTIEIPKPCQSEEDKLLWIVLTNLMNLFNSGNFEMGYTFLTEFTETWTDVYLNMIPLLKTCTFKDDLVSWAVAHFMFAKDITDKDEFELFGYKITKINK